MDRLIQRERQRVAERLKPHFTNSVWEKRTTAPEDWSKPLPEYMEERQRDSYLALYTRHQKKVEEASSSELMLMTVHAKAVNATSCSIM